MSFRRPYILLKKLGLITGEQTLLSTTCRDSNEISVLEDSNTGVIYLDWPENKVHKINYSNTRNTSNNFCLEDLHNTTSRINEVLPFVGNEKILDFGCGDGSFLNEISKFLGKKKCIGIEASENARLKLEENGISALQDLKDLDEKVSLICCFHVLEHLDQPELILKSFRNLLSLTKGYLIIEVPHSNDPLLRLYKNQDFKNFTFWSQHLILHNEKSLRALCNHAGFSEVNIVLKQRYPLSNHLNWLIEGKPGGHKTKFSLIDNDNLNNLYANSLIKMGYSDTILAICKF